ncbi:CoA transferase [Arthrobacter sp. NQ4]|nr:CoA transferase [Arthrobacter sp. NQ4]MDE8589419.1 CoA transferase [Arthrobacter sp. NQ4]
MAAPGTPPVPRWWAGPLDVEGLALQSVEAAAEALNLYTGSPGRYSTTAVLTAAAFDSFGHLRIAGRKPQGFAPLSGFRKTADGWIRLHANYPHHEQRLLQALGATSAEGVERELQSMAALEAEAAIQRHGGIGAAVRTRGEWLATDMGRGAGSGPWVAVEQADGTTSGFGLQDIGAATEASPSTVSGTGAGHGADGLPLAGVRVLDLTRVIAGPVATRLLAALGADVLRIDPPAFPEIEDQFVDTAFGKRSAVLDLGPAANRQNFQQLLAGADAVVTGYRHGALDRFGLNPRELLAAHPGLVVVTLDSWGGSGPWSGLRGFDSIVQAASGIAHLYGREDDDGRWPGCPSGAGAGPCHRLRGGCGCSRSSGRAAPDGFGRRCTPVSGPHRRGTVFPDRHGKPGRQGKPGWHRKPGHHSKPCGTPIARIPVRAQQLWGVAVRRAATARRRPAAGLSVPATTIWKLAGRLAVTLAAQSCVAAQPCCPAGCRVSGGADAVIEWFHVFSQVRPRC